MIAKIKIQISNIYIFIYQQYLKIKGISTRRNKLKTLARDLYENRVFTDRHVPERDCIKLEMIFMPIIFGAFDKVKPEDVGLIYEYYSEAAPRSINGYPIFFSLQYLPRRDLKLLDKYYNRYRKLQNKYQKGIK